MGNNIREIHKQIIVEKSIDLFIDKGIDEITMTDIANEVGVGEATLYRYFGRKQNIIMLSAIHLWESVCNKYLLDKKGKTGLEKICFFYNAFLTVFSQHKEYLSFIYELDNLIIKEKIDLDLLIKYQSLFDKLSSLWLLYYKEGIEDKTVRKLDDPTLFYITSTHSILNICKKLSKEKTTLSSDNLVNPDDEIRLLIDIIMNYIKNK